MFLLLLADKHWRLQHLEKIYSAPWAWRKQRNQVKSEYFFAFNFCPFFKGWASSIDLNALIGDKQLIRLHICLYASHQFQARTSCRQERWGIVYSFSYLFFCLCIFTLSSLHFAREEYDRLQTESSEWATLAGQRQLVGKKKAGAWKPEEVGLRLNSILLKNIVKSYYCVLEEINKKWGKTLTFWWKLEEDRLRQSAY